MGALKRQRPQHNRKVASKNITHAQTPRGTRALSAKSIDKRVLCAILVLLLVGMMGVGIYFLYQSNPYANASASQTTDYDPAIDTKELTENPIDFPMLKQLNPDIYSWIYVPGTEISLPVLQHPEDDYFYLTHNSDKIEAAEGAIFTQSMNSMDYTDPVTVLYGHNMKALTMFAQLHYFEDPDFFNANDTIYIYCPTKILTYRIVSSYLYDNRHILNSYDFSDAQVVQDYFDMVCNPDALIKNIREGFDLDAGNDRIVQLSTCAGDNDRRYIVTGALVDERPTL